MVDVLTIANSHWSVGLIPETGGSVAFGKARVGDAWVDVLRPTSDDERGSFGGSSSYPLVPWSNRIRHGSLLWDGEVYQLRRWGGTADFSMHGTALEYPWEVIEATADRVVVEFDARGYYGVNWPWDFVARQEYYLDGPRLACRMSLTNVDDVEFPAGLGHHPYFMRQLIAPDGSALGGVVQLQIQATQEYELVNCMPDKGAGPIAAVSDFTTKRGLDGPLVDTCQRGRTGPTVATIDYPGALSVVIEADPIFEHTVFYIPPGQPFFAVEPVTNANDGFTLFAKGIKNTGVFSVPAGETVTAEFSVTIA
jgi:aldose 1-epimerase